MGAFIAKQPNGLYCRYSYVVEFRAKGIHKKKYFSSKEEASKWYLKQKQQYIITLANDYYSKKLIHKRAYDGMLKYALENLV